MSRSRSANVPTRSTGSEPYAEIRRRIIAGEYRPGERLIETVLAAALGTSRTPVREALSRLAADGLVERVPNAGCTVAALSPSLLRDTFEVRLLLEVEAAALAASHRTDAELQRMRDLAGYDFRVGDADAYASAVLRNADFHLAIARASHNGLLADMVERCFTQMNRFWAQDFGLRTLSPVGPETSDDPMQASNREHAALVEAIEASDVRRARDVMRTHIERNRSLMARRLLGSQRR